MGLIQVTRHLRHANHPDTLPLWINHPNAPRAGAEQVPVPRHLHPIRDLRLRRRHIEKEVKQNWLYHNVVRLLQRE